MLPGVTVTLTSPVMPGGPATEVTNAQGEYRFTRLAPGTYELKVSLPGFGTYQETDLRVAVGGTTERAVTLKLGAVTETITVSGQSPVVDTRRSRESPTISPPSSSRPRPASAMARKPIWPCCRA